MKSIIETIVTNYLKKYGSLDAAVRNRMKDLDILSSDKSTVGLILRIEKEFWESGYKSYKIAETFGRHLFNTDIDVLCDHLPESMQPIFIKFPSGFDIRADSGLRCGGCLVEIVPRSSSDFIYPREGPTSLSEKVFAQVLICSDNFDLVEKKASNADVVTILYLLRGVKIGEIVDGTPHDMGAVNKFVSKILLYIDSGNPDLEPIEPRRYMRGEKSYNIKDHRSLIPYINVGYSYGKHIKYQIEGTTVCGHFRWQPYGENLSRVKLIWIDAHERTYKSRTTENPLTPTHR